VATARRPLVQGTGASRRALAEVKSLPEGMRPDVEAEARGTSAALRTEVAELRAVVDRLPVATVVVDRAGRVTRWNRGAERMFGWTADEVVGGSIPTRPEDGDDEVAALCKAALDGETRQSVEVQRRRKDGSPIDVRVTVAPLPGEDGRIEGAIGILEDLTDQRRTQRELERTQSAVDRSSVGVVLLDRDSRIVYINDATLEIYRATAEHVRNRAIKHSNPRLEGQAWHEWLDKLRGAGTLVQETVHLRDDGTEVPLEITSHYLEFDGEPMVYSFVRDITDRIEAEARRRAQETLYRQLAEASNVGIWHVDRAGHTIYANPIIVEMLELDDPSELERVSYHAFFSEESLERLRRQGRDAMRNDRYRHEITLCGRKGGRRETLLSGSVVRDEDGKTIGMIGTFTDIGDVKRVRRELQRTQFAVDRATAAIFWWGLDGHYVYVNDAACEQLGYDRDELLTQCWQDNLPPEEVERMNRDVAPAFQEQGHMLFETEHVRRDGHRFPVEVQMYLLNFDEEQLICAFVHDITERKRTERELREAKEHAEYANRAKTEFLANMSHELRTPLNAINGFSEIMAEEMFGPLGTEPYREYVRDINQSGRHLLQLINDILDLSKIEAGKLELYDGPVDLERLFAASLRIVGERTRRAGLEVSSRIEDGLGRIHADERALKQVLLNLLTNAAKFTPEGGRIELSAERRDDGHLVVAVADTGVGMATQDIPRALKRFEQLHGSLGRPAEGTGLGLPLVAALVELHGGTIEIDSEPGVGTTVRVVLPAERVL